MLSENFKKIKAFNQDAIYNAGYKYTTNAPYSSLVANQRLTRITIENLSPRVQNLIDIGCGDGTYTQQIKQACPWLKVKGIDLASAAITVAAKRNSKIKFSVADILKVKLKPKSAGFDVGVLRGVLHHLNDPALAIQNAFLLAERLIIIEPNGNNPLLKLIEKTSRYHLEHGERSFSTKQLRDFCEQGGGKCKKIAYIGFVPFFFPERLARILRFFQDPLEKIFPLVFFFGAQIVLICEKNRE